MKERGEEERRRGGEEDLGDEGSGNPGRRRGRMEEERGIRKRRREGEGLGDEEEWEGGANERLGWGGGTVFLAMQVLEIPAGGRRFPLVHFKLIKNQGEAKI